MFYFELISGNYWSSKTTSKPNQFNNISCIVPVSQGRNRLLEFVLSLSFGTSHYGVTPDVWQTHSQLSYKAHPILHPRQLVPASQSFLWEIKPFPYGNVGDFFPPIHWSNCDFSLFHLPAGYPGINDSQMIRIRTRMPGMGRADFIFYGDLRLIHFSLIPLPSWVLLSSFSPFFLLFLLITGASTHF